MQGFCLVTDIDGTLIGEESSTIALRQAVLRRRSELESRGARLHWVIATGRRFDSACEVLLESGFELADFDGFVTSVGAELYLPKDTAPCAVYAAELGAGGFQRDAVLEALAACDFLSLQPDHEQLCFKVSYFLPDRPECRVKLQEALARLPFPAETIVSYDEYLDVVPRPGGKGAAVAHLIERWGLTRARTVAAGDSGNDLNMLDRDWSGIVVGNGATQLAALRGRSNVYFATAKYGAGVFEGLCALGFIEAAGRARLG